MIFCCTFWRLYLCVLSGIMNMIFLKSSRNARLFLYGELLGACFYSLYIIVSDCMPKTAAVFAAAV